MKSSRSYRLGHFEPLEFRRVLDASAMLVQSAEGEGDVLPDFSLVDANSTSNRFEQSVSPRDYLEEVSAWYFGHAS